MRPLILLFASLTAFGTAACGPRVVYVVATPTPIEAEIRTAAPSVTPAPTDAPPTAVPTNTFVPTAALQTSAPAAGANATPNVFPTDTVAQIQVAEQVFENGRMFWLQPVGEIWVMEVTGDGNGVWLRFEDTFVDGQDLETDPTINAPEGKIQPERGFGKLWRENPEVRDALGWAITPEFGYTNKYEYKPGGTVRNGQFVSGPGRHEVLSLENEAFCFIEESGTWQLGC